MGKLTLLAHDGSVELEGLTFEHAVQKMEEYTDDMAKETKLVKELERLPIEQFFEPNHIDDFIKALKTDFGGGRISGHMLEMLLQMQALKTVITVAPEKYDYALQQLGVTREQIEEQIKEAPTAGEKIEKMVGMFRGLFGSSDSA